MEEPEGIPGHVSHGGPVRRLQEALKELGISYEAEGETTRIHLGQVIVELKDDPEYGKITQVQAPLPQPGDNPREAGETLKTFAEIVSRLTGEARYTLEELVPGYPSIIAVVPYGDVEKQVQDLLGIIVRSLEGIGGKH